MASSGAKSDDPLAVARYVTPYHQAARRGQLVLPHCGACGRYHWYPQARCPYCGAPEWGWQEVRCEGRLFTWSVVHHNFDPLVEAFEPFTVGLVSVSACPEVRLVSALAGGPWTMDMEMRGWFTDGPEPGLVFTPALQEEAPHGDGRVAEAR